MSTDRATFQQLAEERLAEAQLLLANKFWSGAYYLAGYSLECALKAKIASSFRDNEIPELKRVQKIYTHDLSSLLALAGLKDELEAEMNASADCASIGRSPTNGPSRSAMRFVPRCGHQLCCRLSAVTRDC